MDSLPPELVEYILGSKNLDIEDVINASLACNHLRNVVSSSNYIWKNVYYKRWPHYTNIIKGADVNWVTEIKYVYNIRKRVRQILETMPPRFYHVGNLGRKDLTEWSELTEESPRANDYVIDYLTSFLNDDSPINSIECVPLFTPGNRTLRYYSLKVLEYLKQMGVIAFYKEFMSLPERNQLLEKAAFIIAQWCQPELTLAYADIRKCLDDIANQTKLELRVINPNHPIFNIQPEVFEKWKTENLEESQFNCHHNMQIIQALQMTLFKKHKFCGNVADYYMYHNSFINKVLEKKFGLPITLSIIYESVARRMGLNCEPMNVPAHFLLRLKPDPQADMVLFIDAFNEGQIFPKGVCPHSRNSPGVIPRATAHQVLMRMAANLDESLRIYANLDNNLFKPRSILELLVLISPGDLNYVSNLSRVCISLKMDTNYIQDIIKSTDYEDKIAAEDTLNMLRDYEVNRQNDSVLHKDHSKKRGNVKFAVGMIMKHRTLHYSGIITGWTPLCEASQYWQKTMHVDRLKFKNNQPFYDVMAEDNTRRCVAQENIQIIGLIANPYFNEEIGKHFSHFFVNHYVPNPEKEKEYSEDAAVRHDFYQCKLWQK